MKKIFVATIMAVIIALTTFILVGSSSNLNKELHFSIKKYEIDKHKFYQSNDTLTICTYNMGYLSGMTNNLAVPTDISLYENNMDQLRELLNYTQPDLFGAQEIDTKSERSYCMNQVDSLAKFADMTYVYSSINWDKKYVPFPYWPLSMHFGSILSGQAIFSKFPIVAAETLTLEKPSGSTYFYNLFYLDRMVQISTIALNDTIDLHLLNVHLEAFDLETRQQQAYLLGDIMSDYLKKGPVMVIGDFNSAPAWVDASDAMSILASVPGYASAITEKDYNDNPVDFMTFSSAQPEKMIDYILYSTAHIAKVSAEVDHRFGEVSDHLPLFMKFQVR